MAQTAQKIIQGAGVTTVYSKIFLAENPDYRAGADQAASLTPLMLIGAVDVPSVSSFMTAFKQQHFNPEGAAGRRDRLGGHRQPEARWDNG